MKFVDYYNQIHGLVGDVRLVFDFQNNLEGIKYYFNENGVLNEFLFSKFLVRDRASLCINKIWQDLKSDFNSKIIVGCAGGWFYCHESVWSPSVDALFLYNALLEKENFASLNISSILDYGCGTGVMGLSLGSLNPHVKTVRFVDINNYALYSTLINIIGNKPEFQCQIITSEDDCRAADVGIVTPYYFPVERFTGSDCYDRIIRAGQQSAEMTNSVAEMSGLTYFVFSSVTEKPFVDVLKYDFSIIDEMWVPFTLGDNTSSVKLVEAALQHGLLDVRESGQFRYWHKIIVGKIHNKRSI